MLFIIVASLFSRTTGSGRTFAGGSGSVLGFAVSLQHLITLLPLILIGTAGKNLSFSSNHQMLSISPYKEINVFLIFIDSSVRVTTKG